MKNLYTNEPKVLLPEKCFINEITIREQIETIYLAHDIPSAGHLGVKRTLEHITRKGKSWPTIKEDVKAYIAGCLACQKGKPWTGRNPLELHPMLIPPGPWSHIGWDLIRPIMSWE